MNEEETGLFNDLWHIGTDMMRWEYQEPADELKEKITKTFEENEQLKDNWNKLKEYCEEATFYYTTGNGEYKTEMVGNARNGIDILDKMLELEQGSDSNE